MRVCAINGSLRGSRGVTHKILQHMCAGIARAGGSWNVIHLAEFMIESCRACNHCQKTKTYKCIFDGQDDAEKVFTHMVDADVLIYASPVYLFGITSLLKRLLERIYSRAPIQGVLLTKSGLFFHATDIFVERLWRTLKYERIYLNSYETGAELSKDMTYWFNHYNDERKHTSLDKLTPNKAYLQGLEKLKQAA